MIYNGILCIFICIIQKSWSACPFQNPFSFLDPPSVTTVVDKDGNMAADRVRVAWGKVDNFKCVDFFQIGNMFYNLLGNKKRHPDLGNNISDIQLSVICDSCFIGSFMCLTQGAQVGTLCRQNERNFS